jgi:DNA (cytosine-5)-methyltransferase 1
MTGCKYVPRKAEIIETEDLVIDGEDQRADDDERTVRIDDKPVRTLSLFAFMDPGNDLEMVLLSALEDNDSEVGDHTVEGAGFVAPLLLNEEDDGQRDDIADVRKQQYIRLTGVVRYTIDYAKQDE